MFQMTISVDDMKAPMFDDPKMNKDYDLLRSSAAARDGHTRLPSQDREAILGLAAHQDKHRLGRQQSILQDIALRCREQDVYDLSGSITKKVRLESSMASESPQVHKDDKATVSSHKENALVSVPSETASQREDQDTGRLAVGLFLERSSTMFPSRRVLCSPRKLNSPSLQLPRLQIGYRTAPVVTARTHKRRGILPTSKVNGSIQWEHYTRSRQDKLAPLTLPSIRFMGVGNRDKVDTYISAHKVPLNHKAAISGQIEWRKT